MSIFYSPAFIAGVVGWELADDEWLCTECQSLSPIVAEMCETCLRPRQD